MLNAGDRLPDFSLKDQNGDEFSSSDLKGKTAVIYFYPRDDTPGCTKEACGFRDAYGAIIAMGVAVVGVSADTTAAHAKFAAKYGLPFKLLSDPDKILIKAFGAWGEKKNYGKVYEGIIRSTFVAGPDGLIKRVFPKVSPEGHAGEILACLRECS